MNALDLGMRAGTAALPSAPIAAASSADILRAARSRRQFIDGNYAGAVTREAWTAGAGTTAATARDTARSKSHAAGALIHNVALLI